MWEGLVAQALDIGALAHSERVHFSHLRLRHWPTLVTRWSYADFAHTAPLSAKTT